MSEPIRYLDDKLREKIKGFMMDSAEAYLNDLDDLVLVHVMRTNNVHTGNPFSMVRDNVKKYIFEDVELAKTLYERKNPNGHIVR